MEHSDNNIDFKVIRSSLHTGIDQPKATIVDNRFLGLAKVARAGAVLEGWDLCCAESNAIFRALPGAAPVIGPRRAWGA
jgi:hypothetical protein